MTSKTTRPLSRRNLRSPRAAALAGIIFSLLLGTSLILVQGAIPAVPTYEGTWLPGKAGSVSLAVTLIPFAGIAFLWFMGVVRDHVGDREDQFFSTVFFGSGLLFLAGLFIWAASANAILDSYAASSDTWTNSAAYIFGRTIMNEIGGVMALRMAGVFMISSGTIWYRADVMPRWLVWLTYAIALGFLLGAGNYRELRLAFPLWVFVVSLYLLRANKQVQEEPDPAEVVGQNNEDDG